MTSSRLLSVCFVLLLGCCNVINTAIAHSYDFKSTVSTVSKSVVAIGFYSPLAHSGNQIRGTGFVIDNGKWIVTNHHVVDEVLDPSVVQHYVVVYGSGRDVTVLKATVQAIDPVHDLALLRVEQALPSITVSDAPLATAGTEVAITGYPIGSVLGLYAATHRGYVAAVTPDAIPTSNSQSLTVDMLSRLENSDLIYQLDATAYPGNSGSPLYLPDTGEVIGVINKVFVSAGKESALSAPTGISYAIPIKHIQPLLKRAKIHEYE